MAKRIQTLSRKVRKSPKPAATDPEDSQNDDEEEVPVVKNVPKSSGLVEADPEDSGESFEVGKNEEEPVLRKVIYTGKRISYFAKFDTNYLKKLLASSGINKQTKEEVEQFFKQRR